MHIPYMHKSHMHKSHMQKPYIWKCIYIYEFLTGKTPKIYRTSTVSHIFEGSRLVTGIMFSDAEFQGEYNGAGFSV